MFPPPPVRRRPAVPAFLWLLLCCGVATLQDCEALSSDVGWNVQLGGGGLSSPLSLSSDSASAFTTISVNSGSVVNTTILQSASSKVYWMGGGCASTATATVYGTMGVPSDAVGLGGRYSTNTWIATDGAFYAYGTMSLNMLSLSGEMQHSRLMHRSLFVLSPGCKLAGGMSAGGTWLAPAMMKYLRHARQW
jgi:hypothetical protein